MLLGFHTDFLRLSTEWVKRCSDNSWYQNRTGQSSASQWDIVYAWMQSKMQAVVGSHAACGRDIYHFVCTSCQQNCKRKETKQKQGEKTTFCDINLTRSQVLDQVSITAIMSWGRLCAWSMVKYPSMQPAGKISLTCIILTWQPLCELRKEKKRKVYPFRRQFNESQVLYRAAQLGELTDRLPLRMISSSWYRWPYSESPLSWVMVGDSNRSNWNRSGLLMNSDTACAAVPFTLATSCNYKRTPQNKTLPNFHFCAVSFPFSCKLFIL